MSKISILKHPNEEDEELQHQLKKQHKHMEEGNKKEKDEKSKKKIKESIIKHSPISMRETTHPSGIDSSEREEK